MTPKEYVIILTWAFSIPALMIRELINQVRA
jgi:hypothetical protein